MITTKFSQNKLIRKASDGFTLIELLIVIVIIGILAAVLLVAIDPVEQINRANDSGRINDASEVARAVQTYYTDTQTMPNVAPGSPTTFITTLHNSGDLQQLITPPSDTVTCPAANAQNKICMSGTAASWFVWVMLNSKSDAAKGAGAATPCVGGTAYVFDSTKGTGGVTCLAASTVPTSALVLH